MISFGQFILNRLNKYCNLGVTGEVANQCVNLANAYIEEVLGLPPVLLTDASDYPSRAGSNYDYILNTPTGVPQLGDLVVWGPNPGHIAIFIEGDTNRFSSFDQNYPVGSKPHIQEHPTYFNVLGWLRCKVVVPALTPVLPLDYLLTPQDYIDLGVQDKPIDHTHNVGTLIKDLGLELDKEVDYLKEISDLKQSNTTLQNSFDQLQKDTQTTLSKSLGDKNASEANSVRLAGLLGEAQDQVKNLELQEQADLETIKELKGEIENLQEEPLKNLSSWKLIQLAFNKFLGK